MASSTCAKCGNHRFEIKLIEMAGAAYKKYFAQCSSCGTPVGVLDYKDNTALLDGLKEDIAKIKRHLGIF